LVRFSGEEVVRSRRRFFGALLGLTLVAGVSLAARGPDGASEGMGLLFMLGMWTVAAPFCRSWVDEDVRLGYAGLWLQKPVRPHQFYLARLLALIAWAAAAAFAVSLAIAPGFALSGDVWRPVELVLGAGWIPVLLVVLGFLGSGLGARNGALFAYSVLFAGFALQGLADSLWLGPAYHVLATLLPPAPAGFAAASAFRSAGVVGGVARLTPLLTYTAVAAALGLLLAMKVPARLARSE
jgi:hypothetical protein